jgi:hypothetical protein
MLPADSTIAACVAHWEFGVSHRQLNQDYTRSTVTKRLSTARFSCNPMTYRRLRAFRAKANCHIGEPPKATADQ